MSKTRKPRRTRVGLVIGKWPGAEDSINSDGEVEIRNERIILHEPFASRVKGIKSRTGMTYKQMLRRAFELLQEQSESEDAAGKKRAEKKTKTQTQRKKRRVQST